MQNEETPRSPAFYHPSKSSSVPFPYRLKKQKKDDDDERLLYIFRQIHINLPFLEAMIHMPKEAKVLKDLLWHKEKLEKVASSVKLIEPLEWEALENRLKPSSIEPPKLELKELPEHLEYAFLQENNQLSVVISSALSATKKTRLLEVLRNHKGATAWSIANTKGIDSSFYTHKILMEDEFKPSVQSQRWVNPNIKEVGTSKFLLPRKIRRKLRLPAHMAPSCTHECHSDYAMLQPLFSFLQPLSKKPREDAKEMRRDQPCIELGEMPLHGFHRRSIKDFSQVARLMTQLLREDIPFNFSEECKQAFDKLKQELTRAPIMIKLDCSLPFESICDASDYVEFNIEIRNKKDAENLAANHLSRLENPDLRKLTKAEIRDLFPEE
ncbi:reverse transcriptase domain-containing protein [Tanacetum coccineum]